MTSVGPGTGQLGDAPIGSCLQPEKYLKFDRKRLKSGALVIALAVLAKSMLDYLFGGLESHRKLALDIRTEKEK